MTCDQGSANGLDKAYSDFLLQQTFGSTRPLIARRPHCIFPAGRASLISIRAVVNCPIAGWGNTKPIQTESGECYLEPPDSKIIDDFGLWTLPANQMHALSLADRLPGFAAIIPATTPRHVLAKMYASDIGEDDFEYDKCIEPMGVWVDDLGWAYVPLEVQAEFAVFVTSVQEKALIEEVRTRLGAHGISPVFSLHSSGDRIVWTGPAYLEMPGGRAPETAGDTNGM